MRRARPRVRRRVRWQVAVRFTVVMGLAWSPAVGEAQWISPPGEGWVEGAFFFHDTRSQFDQRGEERTIFAEGRAITRSLFLTASVGLVKGVDAWLQLPVHSLRFTDAAAVRQREGVGDPRIFLRVGPERIDAIPNVPVAIRGGVKVNGGDFELDAEIIPLGEGQRDWELMLEVGHSFYPRDLWAAGWVGHRWREANREARREPGDEWFWLGSIGGSVGIGDLGWKLTAEGLHGDPWVIEGIKVRSARRSMIQGFLEVDYPVGPGHVSVGVREPLRGRNLPSGGAVTAGYFLRFGDGS